MEQNIQRQWNYKRYVNNRRRKKGIEEIFEAIMTEFFKVNDRKQTTDPGSSENTKSKNKTKQKNKVPTHRHTYSK